MAIEVQVDLDLSIGAVEPASFVLLSNVDSDTLDSVTVAPQNAHATVSGAAVQDTSYYFRKGSRQIAANKAVRCTLTGVSTGIAKILVTGTCASGRVTVVQFNIEVK